MLYFVLTLKIFHFHPDAITSRNNIITHLNDVLSIDILKAHITSLIRPVEKSIFDICDPLGLRYLFKVSQKS